MSAMSAKIVPKEGTQVFRNIYHEARESQAPRWVATRSRLQHRRSDDETSLQETEGIAEPFDWTPTITMLLLGARDANSPLSLLRGKEEEVLEHIMKMLTYEYREGAVTITPPAHSVAKLNYFLDKRENAQQDDTVERHGDEDDEELLGHPLVTYQEDSTVQVLTESIHWEGYVVVNSQQEMNPPQIAFSPCGSVKFPEPTGININMMPFIMGDRDSLPENLWPYYDMIVVKCPVDESEQGQVMYLSVQESLVKATESQRRPGLHIEAPAASIRHSGKFDAAKEEFRWGDGSAVSPDELHGGLYLASNTSNTTAVWDALVDSKLGAVDTLGGIEHLRPYIGKGKKLPGGMLVWMTDRTPHEAVPQPDDGHRQFFRLVTADISVWFAEHSTPNPKVPVPAHVKIIGENKFKDPKESASATRGLKRKETT